MAYLDLEGILEEVIGAILYGGGIQDVIAEIVAGMGWLLLLLAVPSLLYNTAICFFGSRIYRVLLVIQSALTGGLIGAVLFGIMGDSIGIAILGFLLIGALCGAGGWFFYKVFLFFQSFGIGLSAGLSLAILTGSMGVGIAIGIILGIALGVLTCIYVKWLVMGTTAFKGGKQIGTTLALFVLMANGSFGAFKVAGTILAILFIAGGFTVQFLQDRQKPCNLNGKQIFKVQGKGNGGLAKLGVRKPADSPNVVGAMPAPQPKPQTRKCRLTGVDGMYKGVVFDIDRDTTMGRDVNTCNIIFPNNCAGVSKVQCELKLNTATGAVSVVDRLSTYGTSVNGIKLEKGKPRYLSSGDMIMFGENNVFKFEYQA